MREHERPEVSKSCEEPSGSLDEMASAFQASRWELITGDTVALYFDADHFLADPQNGRLVAEWVSRALKEIQEEDGPIDCLAFIENTEGPTGLMAAKMMLSQLLHMRTVIVRPSKRIQAHRIKGEIRPGDSVVILDDTLTTGHSMRRAAAILRDRGARVRRGLVLYDREELDAGTMA